MDHPYVTSASSIAGAPCKLPPVECARGLVGNVRVLGILMVVQGALYSAMGTGLIAFPLVIGLLSSHEPPGFFYVRLAIFGVPGVLHILLAALTFWGGWQVYRFRQRTFGIVALVTDMISVLMFYCGITATGLLIYGLVVLLDDSVKYAFQVSREGYTVEQINAMFPHWGRGRPWDENSSIRT